MKYEDYQAINLLLKERINSLEITRLNLRGAIAYRTQVCDKNDTSYLSALHYEILNTNKNQLRSANRKLAKWRKVHASFKTDMSLTLDDKRSSDRLERQDRGFFSKLANLFKF